MGNYFTLPQEKNIDIDIETIDIDIEKQKEKEIIDNEKKYNIGEIGTAL